MSPCFVVFLFPFFLLVFRPFSFLVPSTPLHSPPAPGLFPFPLFPPSSPLCHFPLSPLYCHCLFGLCLLPSLSPGLFPSLFPLLFPSSLPCVFLLFLYSSALSLLSPCHGVPPLSPQVFCVLCSVFPFFMPIPNPPHHFLSFFSPSLPSALPPSSLPHSVGLHPLA